MQTWSINQIKSLSTLILSPYKCPLSLPLFSRYTRQFCFSLLLSHSPVWSRRNRGGRIIRRNSDYYLRTQFDQFGTEAVLHFIPSDCSDLLFRVAIRQASLQTDASLWFVEVAFFTRQSIFFIEIFNTIVLFIKIRVYVVYFFILIVRILIIDCVLKILVILVWFLLWRLNSHWLIWVEGRRVCILVLDDLIGVVGCRKLCSLGVYQKLRNYILHFVMLDQSFWFLNSILRLFLPNLYFTYQCELICFFFVTFSLYWYLLWLIIYWRRIFIKKGFYVF